MSLWVKGVNAINGKKCGRLVWLRTGRWWMRVSFSEGEVWTCCGRKMVCEDIIKVWV